MIHQTFLFLGQLWQLFEVSQILEFFMVYVLLFSQFCNTLISYVPLWGVLLVWIRVGQGPTALAVGAGGGCLDIFTLIYPFSPLSPSLWEMT